MHGCVERACIYIFIVLTLIYVRCFFFDYRHCPHEEDAEGFVEAISSWMDSVAHESGKEVALQSNRQTVV